MRLITVPRIHDPRGSLSVIEGNALPFIVRRVYYLYDIPAGETQRGAHAHKACHRAFFCLSGSVELTGESKDGIHFFILSKPWEGVYVPPMTWCQLTNFSGGAVFMVLASHVYDAADYIRDRSEWENYMMQAQMLEKP